MEEREGTLRRRDYIIRRREDQRRREGRRGEKRCEGEGNRRRQDQGRRKGREEKGIEKRCSGTGRE